MLISTPVSAPSVRASSTMMEKRRLDTEEQVVLIPSVPPPSVVGVLTSLNKEKGRLYKAVLEKLKGTRTGYLSSNCCVSSPKQVTSFSTPSRVQALGTATSKALVRVQPQGGASFNTKESVHVDSLSSATCTVANTRHCSSSRTPHQTSLLTGTDAVQSMPSKPAQPEKKRSKHCVCVCVCVAMIAVKDKINIYFVYYLVARAHCSSQPATDQN